MLKQALKLFANFDEVAESIESIKTLKTPPQLKRKELKDPFHMLNQHMSVLDLKTQKVQNYSMGSLILPDVAIVDFENKVHVVINHEHRSVSLVYENSRYRYSQMIHGLRPVASAKCKTFHFFIDESRRFYVLDTSVLKENLFKSFVPFFPVGELAPDIDINNIKTDFISRGLKPFDNLFDGEVLEAENIVFYRDEGDRRIRLGSLNRSSLRSNLAFGQWFLFMQAMLVRPVDTDMISLISSIPMDDEKRQRMADMAESLDPALLDYLTTAPEHLIASLAFQAEVHSAALHHNRDRFSDKEHHAEYLRFVRLAHKLLENPDLIQKDIDEESEKLGQVRLEKEKLTHAIEKKNFQGIWRTLDQFERGAPVKAEVKKKYITPGVMKFIGSVVVAAISLVVINQETNGQIETWALELYHHVFGNAINIIHHEAYFQTFLKYAVTTTMLIPVLFMVATFISRRLKGVHWDFKQTWAVAGIRVSAYTDLPFYHYIAQLFRQPNFMFAMRLGINPFKKIGDCRPGLTNPFQTGERFQYEIRRRAELLDAEAKKEIRRQALATSVGFTVAAQQGGVEQASLTLVNEEGRLTRDGIEALYHVSTRTDIQKKWVNYSDEISYNVASFSDIAYVSLPVRSRAYAIARAASERKPESKFKTIIRQVTIRSRRTISNVLSAVGNYAVPQYQVLRTDIPNRFVATQAWKEFVMDWLLSIWEVGLFGKRSDLTNPAKLAAQEGAVAWANPHQLADLGNQAATFAAKVPGHLMLVYHSKQRSNDKAFDAIEEQSLRGAIQADTYITGMTTWLKDALNIRKARHGAVILRTFIARAMTYQGAFVLMAASRLLTGAQTIFNVLQGFMYYQLEQYPRASIYMTMTNRSNQMYDQKFDHLAEVFSQTKVQLGQGLRLNETENIKQGYRALAKLYTNSEVVLPEKITMHIKSVENHIASGEIIMKKAAQELLDFALKNPPFATRKNEMVDFTSFMAALSARAVLSVPAVIMSLDTTLPWTEKLTHAAGTALTIIGGLYIGEIALLWVLDKRVVLMKKMKMLFTSEAEEIVK